MPQTEVRQIGKRTPPAGVAPSIILDNPKFAVNVAQTVRLASCYGFKQVWWTGHRVALDIEQQQSTSRKRRLPREERMKGYKEVEMIEYDRPLDLFDLVIPVAVEVREDSELLYDFEHPEHAVYVFGPEDGSVRKQLLHYCHRFVTIPSRHCLNLATAVATVLYDREKKLVEAGLSELVTPGEFEQRGFIENPVEEVFG